MKEQLEGVVLQMYMAGVRCSEAVREFQKAFILAVLKDQRGNQCKAAEKLGVHRNTLRRTIRALEIDIGPITQSTSDWLLLFEPILSIVDSAEVRRSVDGCQCRFSVQTAHRTVLLLTHSIR